MSAFLIPKEDTKAVKMFLALKVDEADRLGKAIEATPPATISKFMEQVSKRSGLDTDAAKVVLELLFKMCALYDKEKTNVDDFSKQLFASFSKLEGIQIREESKVIARIKQFLRSENTLGLVIKSAISTREYDRTFCSAHIYSDIRPIFSDDLSRPGGGTITHSLNISYHRGKEHKEFYVALESSDLKKVAAAIDRALKKDKAMRLLLEKSDLPYLGE